MHDNIVQHTLVHIKQVLSIHVNRAENVENHQTNFNCIVRSNASYGRAIRFNSHYRQNKNSMSSKAGSEKGDFNSEHRIHAW